MTELFPAGLAEAQQLAPTAITSSSALSGGNSAAMRVARLIGVSPNSFDKAMTNPARDPLVQDQRRLADMLEQPDPILLPEVNRKRQ
jgi:hypothetical protein